MKSQGDLFTLLLAILEGLIFGAFMGMCLVTISLLLWLFW